MKTSPAVAMFAFPEELIEVTSADGVGKIALYWSSNFFIST